MSITARAVVYRTAPQCEHKAALELRQAGARAYVGRDRGSKRNPFTGKPRATAPGYVFADRACQLAFAKHVKSKVGTFSKAELGSLYIARPATRAQEVIPFTVGQHVRIGELHGKVLAISGRMCRVETSMFGKAHSQAIHYTKLRPG